MKIYSEKPLHNFEFWGGAKDRACLLTYDELDEIESILELEYQDGISDTELNDLFWFDFDYVCNLIGLSEEEVFNREKEN